MVVVAVPHESLSQSRRLPQNVTTRWDPNGLHGSPGRFKSWCVDVNCVAQEATGADHPPVRHGYHRYLRPAWQHIFDYRSQEDVSAIERSSRGMRSLTACSITEVRRQSQAVDINTGDGQLWKDVARRISVVGVKRSRRPSIGSTSENEPDDPRPKKRQARKSFAGMTKAQVRCQSKVRCMVTYLGIA